MPRDGSNIYHRPPGTDGIPNYTIESAKYNANVADVEQDLNSPRPIVAGGTGATDANGALLNLGAEKAAQLVTNYDTHVFMPGSFYSAAGATNAPNGADVFSGTVYLSEALANPPTNQNLVVAARSTTSGAGWGREKKAGVWGAWITNSSITDAAYVNVTGDTMTGSLSVQGFVTAGSAGTTGSYYLGNTGSKYLAYDGTSFGLVGARLVVQSGGVTANSFALGTMIGGGGDIATGYTDTKMMLRGGSAGIQINNHANSAELGHFDNLGGFLVTGNGYKPGGGSWVDSSDARIKNEIGDYPRGLAEIAALRPVYYTYKGNDTAEAPAHVSQADAENKLPLVVPYPNSSHATAAKNQTKYAGLIAQEVEAVIPEMVTKSAAYIDGVAVNDMRNLDTTPLIFALINAVKQLNAEIEALKAAR